MITQVIGPGKVIQSLIILIGLLVTESDGFAPSPIRLHAPARIALLSSERTIRHHTQRLPYLRQRYRRGDTLTVLTTKTENDGDSESPPPKARNIFQQAADKFRAQPGTYLAIPFVAAVVGWVTNWMAVQMIFYPIRFWGIPLWRRPEVPLGLLGWQGIVPCKTRPMSEAMVNMVTTQLISVQKVFQRLDPKEVAKLLAPEVPNLAKEVLQEISLPMWVQGVPLAIYDGLSPVTKSVLKGMNLNFLTTLTKGMQKNINNIFDVHNCVINQMLQDRTLLGKLFVEVGQKELDFLTNSGLWFGFLLGLIQMVIALFWDNPWSLSLGGLVVGYATNWLALKWIFEPVNPTRVGPFVLQGQFLRRQKEVSAAFSAFFANKILNSKELWNSVFTDTTTTPAFFALFSKHFSHFLKAVSGGLLRYIPEPEVVSLATKKAFELLPKHVDVLHPYVDKTLNLETSLRTKMELMTPGQFERVLHPIFEEDELTLILAGAALGFGAGLIQQGLATGQIEMSKVLQWCKAKADPFIKWCRSTRVFGWCQARSEPVVAWCQTQSVPIQKKLSGARTFVKRKIQERRRRQSKDGEQLDPSNVDEPAEA